MLHIQNNPELSVVICAHNRAPKLQRALETYLEQTLDPERFEMVLINDGSTDQTGEVMRKALGQLRGTYVEHHVNRGLAAAKNSAIGASRGDYIIFVNDDTYADPHFCERVVDFQKAHAGQKVVGLCYIPFTREMESKIFYRALFDFNLYTPFIGLEEGKPYPFDHFIGTGTCFPREAFIDENIRFDEGYVTYGAEDLECGYRLAQRGYAVYYNPRAVIYHDHEMTAGDYRNRCTKVGINLLHLCAQHPEIQQHYFHMPRITEALVEEWNAFVEMYKPQIEQLTTQIDEVGAQPVKLGSPEEVAQTQELVQVVGTVTKLLFDYETRLAYITTLDQEPLLKQRLMNPEQVSWEQLTSSSPTAEDPTPPSQSIVEMIVSAEEQLEKGSIQAAEEKLSVVLQQEPNNVRALNDTAVAAIMSKDHARAKVMLERVLNIDPHDAVALGNRQYLQQVCAED